MKEAVPFKGLGVFLMNLGTNLQGGRLENEGYILFIGDLFY